MKRSKRKEVFLLALTTFLALLTGCVSQIGDIMPTETGELTAQFGETIPLQSADVFITLDEVDYGTPDYGTMTIDSAMYLKINIPDPEACDRYMSWLSDFTVNGTPVAHDVGMEAMGGFLSVSSASKVYQTNPVIYKVPYTVSEDDASIQVTCKAGDSLLLSWTSDKGFWDIESVDEMDAKAYRRSQQEGVPITAVYAKDLENESLITGDMYMVTGTVANTGVDILGDYYVVLYASGNDVAYGHSSKPMSLRNGEEVSIIGRYDGTDLMGYWNFEDCFL